MYMLSWQPKTLEASRATCCSLNMTLMSMEDATQSVCLANFYKRQPKSVGGTFGNCIENSMASDPVPVAQLSVKACNNVNKFVCQRDLPATKAPTKEVAGTCVPKCPEPIGSISCAVDPKKVKSDGTISVPITEGIVKEVCGKIYMLGWFPKTLEQAQVTCCSMNMSLVSMEDATKSTCLANFYKTLAFIPTTFWTSGSDEGCPGQWTWCNSRSPFADGVQWAPELHRDIHVGVQSSLYVTLRQTLRSHQPIRLPERSSVFFKFTSSQLYWSRKGGLRQAIHVQCRKGSSSTFWTSGKDDGCEGRWGWCAMGRFFNSEVTWASGKPSGGSTANCAQITLGGGSPPTALLADQTCSNTAQFICEPKKVKSDGTISVPITEGIVKEVCGKIYMLGWFPKTLEQAQVTCCSMNMSLVSMEDATKSTCLANFYKTLAFIPTTFWTSGTDEGCPGQWTWCNSRSPFADGVQWAPGQPKSAGPGLKNCVETSMSVSNPPATLLSVKPCALTNRYACQKDPPTLPPSVTTQVPTTVTPPPCGPTCTNATCTVESNAVQADGTVQVAGNSVGTAKTICGKQYMFSTQMASYDSADKICCALGMKLLSLESGAEAACLAQIYQGSSSTFWTSGKDDGCEGRWGWCAMGRFFNSEITWVSGKPSGGTAANCAQAPATEEGTPPPITYASTQASITVTEAPATLAETDTTTQLTTTIQTTNAPTINVATTIQATTTTKATPAPTTPAPTTPAPTTPAPTTPTPTTPAPTTPAPTTPAPTTPTPATTKAATTITITTTSTPSNLNQACVNKSSTLDQCGSQNCTVNCNYVHPNGSLKVPSVMGKAYVDCGQQYFFSMFKKNQSEAFSFCCALGMKLLSVETIKEGNCINQMFIDKKIYSDVSVELVNSVSRESNKPDSWKWCPEGPIAAELQKIGSYSNMN
ncbi:hypothetical protein B566_EDAN011034 [Ephemera danica]|nr:hypothetical protein B566_EDAN011034 [Ephemera danica]